MNEIDHKDTRAPYYNGNSLVVTLPKKALERNGIEPEDLDQTDCDAQLDDGIFSIDLDVDD